MKTLIALLAKLFAAKAKHDDTTTYLVLLNPIDVCQCDVPPYCEVGKVEMTISTSQPGETCDYYKTQWERWQPSEN